MLSGFGFEINLELAILHSNSLAVRQCIYNDAAVANLLPQQAKQLSRSGEEIGWLQLLLFLDESHMGLISYNAANLQNWRAWK